MNKELRKLVILSGHKFSSAYVKFITHNLELSLHRHICNYECCKYKIFIQNLFVSLVHLYTNLHLPSLSGS